MKPHTEKMAPEEIAPGVWERLIFVIRKNRHIAWMVFLIACLVVLLVWLPPQLRILIWRGLVARGALSSMLLGFGLVAISLVWSAGQRMDVWAFLYFNLHGSRPVWLDRMMMGLTQVGNGITALVIGLILFFARERLAAYELVLGTLTLWIVVEFLKAVVRRPRPVTRVSQARVVGYPASGLSFPSGHTSQVFFMATLMTQYFHTSIWVTFLLYTVALLVGITRMYVGAHYPRDVLAGAILGSTWGLLGVLVNDYILNG